MTINTRAREGRDFPARKLSSHCTSGEKEKRFLLTSHSAGLQDRLCPGSVRRAASILQQRWSPPKSLRLRNSHTPAQTQQQPERRAGIFSKMGAKKQTTFTLQGCPTLVFAPFPIPGPSARLPAAGGWHLPQFSCLLPHREEHTRLQQRGEQLPGPQPCSSTQPFAADQEQQPGSCCVLYASTEPQSARCRCLAEDALSWPRTASAPRRCSDGQGRAPRGRSEPGAPSSSCSSSR